MIKTKKLENYTDELCEQFISWSAAQKLKEQGITNEDGKINFNDLRYETNAILWNLLANNISREEYAIENLERWNTFIKDRQTNQEETKEAEEAEKIEKTREEEMLFLEVQRDGYSPEQCGETMTVGELIEFLKGYDEDTPIYISNDKGFTFGSITEYDFRDTEEYEEE